MNKFPLLLLALLLLTACCRGEMEINGMPLMVLCQQAANTTWQVGSKRLLDDPYNPGTFAWELSYGLRAFVDLYNLTGNPVWLNRAISWSDHLLNYSDVNGDGEPAWGNYNETWGTDRYEFVEFTVHDGVVSVPLLELVQLIHGRAELVLNETLKQKADAYLDLVKRVVDRHHAYWTDVTEDSGYYWNDPTSDELVIVNRFAALGIAEFLLCDILQDSAYLDKPERMARLIKDNLKYDERDDCYVWPYAVGQAGAEDVSHGSIDLEFMIEAYQHSLVFNETDMRRLVNTYQRKIWQGIDMFRTGIALAMRVDGTVVQDDDYTRLAHKWPLLCLYEPRILQQHRMALEVFSRKYLPMDRVMAETLSLMVQMEIALQDRGIDADFLTAFLPEEVVVEIDKLNATVASAEKVGGFVGDLRALTDDLYVTYVERMAMNISSLLETIWQTTLLAHKARAEAYLMAAQDAIWAAKRAGIDTSRHELFLQRAMLSMDQGLYESVVSLCAYPISLREQLDEGLTIPVLVLISVPLMYRWAGGGPRRVAG